MKLLISLTLCFFIAVTGGMAQPGKETKSVPGGHFVTSGSRTFWMGTNYRKEWNTPITVPVLDLTGLTPTRRGGGKQTKSLRFEDANGREYTIRSIPKYITSKTLPGGFESEAAADLVSDGVSASYPYAPLSVAVLSEAAGIPHGNPKLVYIPDDPRLGEFRKDFGNMLAMYEERVPDSVKKGYNTDEVVEKLEKDNDNDVDQHALLKIRILDMFVMDLDRHEGQWSWGAYDNGKGKMFYPLAKDRDQAFYINQGVLPGIVKGRALVPQLEGFKAKANSIERFNFAARNLDRFFLNQLTEKDWQEAVDKFIPLMTDEVIDRAMNQQPAEIRSISADKIAKTLKERRKYLAAEVMEYYHFLAEIVNVTGSDKKELFDVTRNDDGSVLVQVFKVDKDGAQSYKMYERKFMPLETKEIRLYGFDGDDRFTVHGGNDKIKIRIIGGGGQDVFHNTEPRQPGTIIYDRKDAKNTVEGGFKNRMSNDSSVNSFQRIYYKYAYQSVFFTLGYNPDDGLSLGPSFKYVRHGFRKEPFKSQHFASAVHSLSTKAFRFRYNGEFMQVFGPSTDIVADIDYKGPNNTSNFFGYGINSVYDKTKPGKFKYYRARYDLGDFTVQIRQKIGNKLMFLFGPTYQTYSMDSADKFNKIRNIYLNSAASGINKATAFNKQSYFGGKFSMIIDTRDNPAIPEKGVDWETNVRWLKGTNNASYDKVTQLNSDFAFYLNLIPKKLTWANRVGGGITFGDKFEFYQAQYLGSDDNLRGYRKARFAGKSKFYNQTELRWQVATVKTYLFPAAFGLFGFFDFGRVWVKNDVDDMMRSGYGGGIWFSPLRKLTITLSYAVSKEDKIPLFGFGWKF